MWPLWRVVGECESKLSSTCTPRAHDATSRNLLQGVRSVQSISVPGAVWEDLLCRPIFTSENIHRQVGGK